MPQPVSYYRYINTEGTDLFTVICLPNESGRFPTLIYRSPYVDNEAEITEEELCANKLQSYKAWLAHGYAIVIQHCRGRGKSDGDCIPYIFEREDSLALYRWVREQSFYNGELYLYGASYTASVHLVTAPFAPDIKGAVFEVQDCNRYNCNYRNGFYKSNLHGGWYVEMYKRKTIPRKDFTPTHYNMLPLEDFSKKVLGEPAPDFDGILSHPSPDDPFWQTRFGGGEARNALCEANIPILLTTGFYDIYTGGIFDMWNSLSENTRALCALAVHPFDHSGRGDGQPINFENGTLREAFGHYSLLWMDYVRGKGQPPFALGQVTYYKLFGNEWRCDGFDDYTYGEPIPLGDEEVTYRYDPKDPAPFKGGLSTNFDGAAWQDPPFTRQDIITLYTPKFTEDTFIKGKIRATLRVRSSCPDTCFYMRLSLCKPEGDYGLRDDINQISNLCNDYTPGDELEIPFSFDQHAFVAAKGERLRIDISSSAFPHYVRHTNNRGLFSQQRDMKTALNTVDLSGSFIQLPTVK